LIDANCKILKNPNHGNKVGKLRLEHETWNMFVWSRELVKKKNRKMVWINFFDIVYDTEEQKENIVYTKSKQM
jgi:hypothetical protein